jgi:hypothetical protein
MVVVDGDGNTSTSPTTGSTNSAPPTHTIFNDPLRPIVLETAKEAYLLSPSALTATTSRVKAYDIALILETEVVVEDQEEQAPPPVRDAAVDQKPGQGLVTKESEESVDAVVVESSAKGLSSDAADADAPSTTSANDTRKAAAGVRRTSDTKPPPPPSPPAHADDSSTPAPAAAPPSPPPPETQDRSFNIDDREKTPLSTTAPETLLIEPDEMMMTPGVKPQFAAVQVLQRGLTLEMFRFAEDRVYVLDGSASDGMEAEWAIQVKNWKWAPRAATLRERVV